MGGRYPLAFVPNCVLALDRNILKILHHLEDGSRRQDLEKNRWWLKFLDTESVTLNPVLCALEGENRSVPTKEEFTVQFNEATIRIKNSYQEQEELNTPAPILVQHMKYYLICQNAMMQNANSCFLWRQLFLVEKGGQI